MVAFIVGKKNTNEKRKNVSLEKETLNHVKAENVYIRR